jgi:flavin-dependent dehydrogenase
VNEQRCEVLVIGGGPGGSTIGALLAKRGREVVLLEKEVHPRFHIGESLLPRNMEIFESLGVMDRLKAIGVVKKAADFTDELAGGAKTTFHFARAVDKTYPSAFQVRRDELDAMLLYTARDHGVVVHEATQVTSVDLNDDARRVTAVDAEGCHHAWAPEFIVDASGRDSLLARRLNWRRRDRAHSTAAMFGHFAQAERREGDAAGNISVYWFEHGWLWMIPLRDGCMSVGAVCEPAYIKSRDCSPEEFLQRTIAMMPNAAARMRDAYAISEVCTAGNYSYDSRRAGDKGFLLIGDALCFIDPVFSSGVLLAMHGAKKGADVVDACLAQPQRSRRIIRRYQREIRRGVRRFSWFIYRFRSPTFRSLFTTGDPPLRIEEAVTTVLSGDVFRRTSTELGLAGFKVVYYAKWLADALRGRFLAARRATAPAQETD